MTELLPAQFQDLSQFADWSLATADERIAKRLSCSKTELRAFYDGILPRIDEVLTYLNGFDLYALPEKEKFLFHIALSMAEIGIYIEWFDAPISPIARGTGEKVKMIFEPQDV